MFNDVECICIDMADLLTHKYQSKKIFLENLEAFLDSFINDNVSEAFAYAIQNNSKELLEYIQKAEKESKSFLELLF